MSGNVVRSKLRRPNVSIVLDGKLATVLQVSSNTTYYMAGMAKSQLVIPVPMEVRSASDRVKPAS